MGGSDRYPALLDHAQDIFLVLAPDGEIQYANVAVERILGYDPEMLVGQDAFEFRRDGERGNRVAITLPLARD